jgi:hypothetical protein
VSAAGPLTLALVPALLIGVGALACYLLARRDAAGTPIPMLIVVQVTFRIV